MENQLGRLQYLVGDATDPQIPEDENGIIAHVCNDIGGWGAGFVLAISKKWKDAENMYRMWHREEFPSNYPKFTLGNVQVVEVEDGIYIANMIAQHSTGWMNDVPPIRYDRVRQCLNKVAKAADQLNASIYMPRIGAGLAGGTWQVIEGLIKETLIVKGIDVYVYDLPAGK